MSKLKRGKVTIISQYACDRCKKEETVKCQYSLKQLLEPDMFYRYTIENRINSIVATLRLLPLVRENKFLCSACASRYDSLSDRYWDKENKLEATKEKKLKEFLKKVKT